jgi:aspartyl-tRNA(Asn)/glutamyl-tRNA(Gln) amidotransferase subunit A
MTDQDLCFLSLAQQADLIRTRSASPVEVVESVLQQIDRVDPKLNSYITVMRDSALADARRAEEEIGRGAYRGSLHGIPVALKDLFYTEGVRTTAGSRILSDFVPAEDATVVVRLRQAGAVIVGKTNMHEFAYGTLSTNPHYGDVRNPWDPERVVGGSSGGSAAAACSYMCSAALGSDTGGSIRIPAALGGVVGLKPTYGRVSRHGAVPCAWSLDHVGPLTRTAEDAAVVLSAIAGYDPKDPASSLEPVPNYVVELQGDLSGLRLAVLREYVTDPTEPEVLAQFQASAVVLRSLGMSVDEISVPSVDAAVGASTAILASEVASYHEEWLRTRADEYGAEVRSRLETGLLIAATDYVKAQRVRNLLTGQLTELLKRYDALLYPTIPVTAPRLDEDSIELGGRREPKGPVMVRHTRLFNLVSFPAISVPCGFDSRGLPVGLHIATAPFTEGLALRVAHAYQQATDWHLKVPAVARG